MKSLVGVSWHLGSGIGDGGPSGVDVLGGQAMDWMLGTVGYVRENSVSLFFFARYIVV